MEGENFKRGHKYNGIFISVEAGEGAGKGTQIEALEESLKKHGYSVVLGKEPGGTPFGEEMRGILQDPNNGFDINPTSEMFGFLAARSEYMEKLVIPSLQQGKVVVSDRFKDSTIAYQGYGYDPNNKENFEMINYLNEIATFGIKPDLTFLLDIDAQQGLEKITGHEFEGSKKDRFEDKELSYHQNVNQGFREIAKEEPERVKTIPYRDGEPEKMGNEIRKYFNEFLNHFNMDSSYLK